MTQARQPHSASQNLNLTHSWREHLMATSWRGGPQTQPLGRKWWSQVEPRSVEGLLRQNSNTPNHKVTPFRIDSPRDRGHEERSVARRPTVWLFLYSSIFTDCVPINTSTSFQFFRVSFHGMQPKNPIYILHIVFLEGGAGQQSVAQL